MVFIFYYLHLFVYVRNVHSWLQLDRVIFRKAGKQMPENTDWRSEIRDVPVCIELFQLYFTSGVLDTPGGFKAILFSNWENNFIDL